MEVQSVRSGHSDRSSHLQLEQQQHRVHGSRRAAQRSHRGSDTESQHLYRVTDRVNESDTSRDDCSVSTRASRRMRHSLASEFIPEDSVATINYSRRSRPIVYDDDWGENTTVITGATSDVGFSLEDIRIGKDLDESSGFRCARYMGFALAAIVGFLAFLSPVAMIALPKINILDWPMDSCKPDCEGLLLGLGFKLLVLLLGSWALFIRRPKATHPRIDTLRAAVLFLVFIVAFAYWLFYGVRIYLNDNARYVDVVAFSGSLVNVLLFINYLSVVLLELRQLQPHYIIKVTRSPDGASLSYTVGQMTIQNLAVWCLEQYYKDFQVYNPYLEHLSCKSHRATGFKLYEVDGVSGNAPVASSNGMLSTLGSGRHDVGHNGRFFEEQEYKRRVMRRRARLVVAAEEAFRHIRRFEREPGVLGGGMSPDEAAQAIFPTFVRPLQKYLRVTRQQPKYTVEDILKHLTLCISHELSSKAFLERYLTQGAVIWNDRAVTDTQTWVLMSDKLLSHSIGNGTTLQLRQGSDVKLLIVVRRIPHLNFVEQAFNDGMNKFMLRLNSEMAV